jgi:hypothetical protein
MRTHFLLTAALGVAVAIPGTAQRGRRSDTARSSTRESSATISSETFRPTLRSGQRLSVSNIEGKVTITQGPGVSAEIVAQKVVRRGDGNLVKAVLEATSGGYRICTVYLNRADEDRGCDDHNRNNNDNGRWREPLDVDMNYEVRLPAGVALTVSTVDGSVDARGIDTPASIRSVDGSINYVGVAPEGLNTVDGSITAAITNSNWDHALSVRSVDGSVELTLPASLNARVSGRTVDGSIDSDFPVTVIGKWGPHSFEGDIGNGHGASLDISTVDGGIRLRSSDGSRNNGVRRRP